MSFRLVISDTVTVSIKGELPDAAGVYRPFNYALTCRRMMADELRRLGDDSTRTLADVMADVARDWSGIVDEDDKPVAFSRAALDQLLNIPGMATLAFREYSAVCGARGKEKN